MFRNTQRLLMSCIAATVALSAQAAAPQPLKLAMQAHKGYFSERCVMLEGGQQLSYRFTTAHPIEFNIHHHPAEGGTVFADRLVVKSQHSKQVAIKSAGEYCFMSTNLEDNPATFDVVINYETTAG